MKVEDYQGATPERLFSYLRDELGTVTGLVEESQTGNPRAPPVAIRYFYDAFGSAHAELGPEVVKTKFDSALTQFTKPDGSSATQTATATTQPGALRILFTSPVTAATIEAGVILEKLAAGTWIPLPQAERALGFSPDSPEELLVLPVAGWEKNGLYRLRLTSNLKDASNRSVVTPPVIQSLIPDQTAPVTFDASYPLLFETAFASSETSGGLFPGGQPMLFTGAWSDPVLGIAYHRARWYDPRNGVFLSEDPETDRDSRNYYAYAGFAPQQFSDPRGRDIWDDASRFYESGTGRIIQATGRGIVQGFAAATVATAAVAAAPVVVPILTVGGIALAGIDIYSNYQGRKIDQIRSGTSTAHVLPLAIADITGIPKAMEGILRKDLGTGEALSDAQVQARLEESCERIGMAIGGAAGAGLTGKAVKGLRNRTASPRPQSPGDLHESSIGVQHVAPEVRAALAEKHAGLISKLEKGDVLMPRGKASAKMMGELTTATGNEVALLRVGKKRVLRMGDPSSVRTADAERIIAHTHPGGSLELSLIPTMKKGKLVWKGDIPRLQELGQRSSVVIGPSGRAKRPHVSYDDIYPR